MMTNEMLMLVAAGAIALLGLAFLTAVSFFLVRMSQSYHRDRQFFEGLITKMHAQFSASNEELQEKLMVRNFSEYSSNKIARNGLSMRPLNQPLSPAVLANPGMMPGQGDGYYYTPEERAEEALRIAEKTGMTPSMAMEGLRTDYPRRSAAILGGEDLG